MPATLADRRSPRDRLLDAADELFYRDGVQSVGIDRVIAHAGVAKASLYKAFGSKEALIEAYLARRHDERRTRLLSFLERYATPRERLLGVFDALAERVAQPDFRGCAFVNASAESPPGSGVVSACDASRAWTRGLFRELAQACGVADADALAAQITLLYDGVLVSARMDRDPSVVRTARAVASTLLDAALRPPAASPSGTRPAV